MFVVKNILRALKISKKLIMLIYLMLIVFVLAEAKQNNSNNHHRDKRGYQLEEGFRDFYPLESFAVYTITVCADLPVDKDPSCVFKKGEPGHVFLILSKKDTQSGKITERSFGFYPRVGVSCIIKQVRSRILDNSNRQYDASIQRQLTAAEFTLVLEQCKILSAKKYNLKKYNCYDYVLGVYNAIPGVEKLPLTRVKFPFIFGRGGSPCGLYRDLKKLSFSNSEWAPFIRFGSFISPGDNKQQLITAIHKN